ncbi:hypothetical protein BD410DRAFT_779753 [Rickenella mellea]|uniref:Uncharacterized protein n=1 Tax=Rickenella mellea TaxID=50990 RepID=A0A4R5XFI7_9AGAM|nr:hypothetical protein BD410DRAFT_779753 [Rickenella mellea]
MFNNSSTIHVLAAWLDQPDIDARRPKPRRRVSSDPCLPSRLPSTGFLQREGERTAPKSVLKHLRRSPSPPGSPDETEFHRRRRSSTASSTVSNETTPPNGQTAIPRKTKGTVTWKEPQAYEIFSAVERKDIMFLMEVRDRAFHLLLRKSGDATPLVHAMRIGESHRDVAILLLGAMSRWVNHLDDASLQDKKTKALLKALRANLKIAIDYGLQRSQSDLTASFMQTLIMSEGERWVQGQASNVSLALRAGTEGKPVHTAETAVRRFATKELGKAESIASLEDYIANATADLLVMGAWNWALDTIKGEPIPTYYFARDDRVFRAFLDRLHEHKAAIARSASRRLKWQLRVLENVLEGRMTTYRSKIELLVGELDEGEGV